MDTHSPMGQSPRLRPQQRGRLSLLSSYRQTNKFNTPGRSQTNQVIIKGAQNSAESFGLPLPVLVTEILTFADNNAVITARLSADGWGWVVCGRRLLIWQYRDKRQRGGSSTPVANTPLTCYELTLPQTDLAHKANLVCVFNTEGNTIPSCFGVSPEGVIRYWYSIAHEGGYIEKTADLHGQECDSLIDVNPIGCVLATTTCTVVLIQANIVAGRQNITTRMLQGSGGWLGGIGRKVSSLFFSAIPISQSAETKLIGITSLGESSVEDGNRICVVAGLSAQLWHLSDHEKLTGEIDLQKTLRDAFLHAAMSSPSNNDPATLDIHILDMQHWNNGLLLLTAAINTVRSPQTRYALAHLCTDEDGEIGQLLGFIPIHSKVSATIRLNIENSSAVCPRMLVTSNTAYIYDQSKIMMVSCLSANDKPDIIELNNKDQILGAGLCHNLPLYFSQTHGIMSIASNERPLDISMCDSPLASPRPSDAFDGHLSLYEIDPRVIVEANESNGQKSTAELLKAAFLHHTRREVPASKALLSELFPLSEDTYTTDSPLDRTVLSIATDLVNDIPMNDPRWSQSNIGHSGAAIGSSNSLNIGLQLQDKRRAFSLLLEFLRASGLWARLSGATSNNSVPAPTVLLLRSLAERLTAAITLRSLQQQPQHQHAIDTAIQQVVSNSDDDDYNNSNATLSPSDLFYKNVSKVEMAIIHAANWCNEQDASGCAPPALSQLISKVNHVIITVLQEVLKYRHQYNDFYGVTPSAQKLRLEHTTWTSCPNKDSLINALNSQQSLSVRKARRAPLELRGELRSQASALGGAILEFAKERTESFLPDSKKREAALNEFAQLRTNIIQPLVDDEEFELASSLAEKFHDFDILVSICEKSNNRDKLYYYMNKFENHGFQQCAFKWFMNRGRGGQAALLKAFPHHGIALSQWLAEQGLDTRADETDANLNQTDIDKTVQTDGSELLWLHELRADRWLQAASALIQLSENETESISRMMLQASLGKLCALASEDDREDNKRIQDNIVLNTDYRLLLANHHALPTELLNAHGLEPDNLRVMEPREIIDMFITYSGTSLTEYDYSRALELCDLLYNAEPGITAEDVIEIRRRIWCATILIDSWDKYDIDSPINTIQDKMFFKVINTVHLLDCNLNEFIVPLDDLLKSKELSHLVGDSSFQYLMKMGYEHAYHTQNEMMMLDD